MALCGNFTSAQLAAARQQEALNAAAILGVPSQNVHLLTYGDAMVTSYPEVQIRSEMIALIRSIHPSVIMTWFPYPRFELLPSAGWDDLGYHPDHQAVGKIALDASFGAGVARLFPELGAPASVSQFYMWEYTAALTHYVDITSVVSSKVKSFIAHETQYPDPQQVQQMVYELGARMAALTLNGTVTLAEAFRAYF